MKIRLFPITALLFFISCTSEVTRSMEPKSTAFGKLNEIVVIADDDIWESEIGDTFRYYFESAYPILPQPEPYFDLRQFSTEEISAEPLRRELRTYTILADLSDENSATTKMVKRDLGTQKFETIRDDKKSYSSMGKDKWARGQLLVYLMGADKKTLIETIRTGFPAISQKVNEHDKNMIESSIYAVELENKGLSKKIEERYGIQLKIPGSYIESLDVPEDNVMWLRKDDGGITQSFLIKSIPYLRTEQLDLEQIIAVRNEMGEYVSTDEAGSKMVVNNEDLPVYEYDISLDNHYAKELRGVWEISNDFLGGAFVSHALVNDKERKIIFIDAFVYAPSEDKRDLIQQMDFIVKQLKVIPPEEAN